MDNLSKNIRNVVSGLDALKNEHTNILKQLLLNREGVRKCSQDSHTSDDDISDDYSTIIIDEKISILTKSLETIEIGLDEAAVLIQLAAHMNTVEAEKAKLSAQVKRLLQESAWLRDELTNTQQKQTAAEQENVQLKEELLQLKFMKSLKYDNNDTISSGSSNNTVNSGNTSSINTPQNSIRESSRSHQDIDQTSVASSQFINDSANSSMSAVGSDIPDRLRTLHNLVVQYATQGRYEVAIPLCKQALEDLENTNGRNHPDVATLLNILALVYKDQNKYREAASLLNDALQIRESTLGPDHTSVAATLNNLAVLFSKRHKYAEAEPLCKRALLIREKVFGENHPDVAKQLNNLALIVQNQGRYDEVETYYNRALKIYIKELGVSDPNVVKTKNNLASAYLKQGKHQLAEETYKEILTVAHELEYGTISASNKTIWMLAEERQDNNLMHEHEPGNWHKVKVENPTVLCTLKNLSSLYRRQGKYDAAEILDQVATRNSRLQADRLLQQRGK